MNDKYVKRPTEKEKVEEKKRIEKKKDKTNCWDYKITGIACGFFVLIPCIFASETPALGPKEQNKK